MLQLCFLGKHYLIQCILDVNPVAYWVWISWQSFQVRLETREGHLQSYSWYLLFLSKISSDLPSHCYFLKFLVYIQLAECNGYSLGVKERKIWFGISKDNQLQCGFHSLVSYIECLTIDCSSSSLILHTLLLVGIENHQKNPTKQIFINYNIDKVFMRVHERWTRYPVSYMFTDNTWPGGR